MGRFFSLGGALALLVLLVLQGGSTLSGSEELPVTITAGAPSRPVVALTFDDGPSLLYTPEILALLKRYQAHATFFVLGRKLEKYPWLVKAELKAGHEVGNHTFSHVRLTKSTQLTREQELERTELDLDLLLGRPPKERLIRPPYSAYDQRLTTFVAHINGHLVLWNLDSGDWRGLGSAAIIKNVLSRVQNGSIIIFHDSDETDQADRRPTVAALKVILPVLRASGYQMVTVSELFARHNLKAK